VSEIEIVRIPVAPENADALAAALEQGRQGYLAPPACAGLEIARGEGEIVAVIHWASPEAHQAAAALPAAGELFGAVQRYAAGPPSLETLPATSAGTLTGQVALVTGGASGIGRAVVDAYVAAGAKVGVADRNAAGLASLKAVHGDRIAAIEADLATAAGNEKAVADTVAAFGKLDVLVANAGLFDGFFDFSGVSVDQLDRGFDEVFGVNVRGLILVASAALPHLVQTSGSIVVTLSNASLYPDGGGLLYVASKHAALGVVRQLAHELAPVVRVNAVAPGATKTPIDVPDVLGGPLDQTAPEISAAIASAVPLGVHVEPAAHAAAYVLLASRTDSAAMTGTVIESDGGLGIRGLRRTRGGDGLKSLFPGE
jgi:2,3-dihydroxy-2,3-dihydrophenylpropionate dehydrogenase